MGRRRSRRSGIFETGAVRSGEKWGQACDSWKLEKLGQACDFAILPILLTTWLLRPDALRTLRRGKSQTVIRASTKIRRRLLRMVATKGSEMLTRSIMRFIQAVMHPIFAPIGKTPVWVEAGTCPPWEYICTTRRIRLVIWGTQTRNGVMSLVRTP